MIRINPDLVFDSMGELSELFLWMSINGKHEQKPTGI